MTPGTVCSTTHGSRDEGMFCSSSTLTFVVVAIFLVSTIGDVAGDLDLRRATPATASAIFSGTLRAGGDDDALIQVVAEAGQLRGDRVRAGREVQEVRFTGGRR